MADSGSWGGEPDRLQNEMAVAASLQAAAQLEAAQLEAAIAASRVTAGQESGNDNGSGNGSGAAAPEEDEDTANQLSAIARSMAAFGGGGNHRPHSLVELRGLAGRPELNGERGVVIDRSRAGRYSVLLENGRGPFSVRPENLLEYLEDDDDSSGSDPTEDEDEDEDEDEGDSVSTLGFLGTALLGVAAVAVTVAAVDHFCDDSAAASQSSPPSIGMSPPGTNGPAAEPVAAQEEQQPLPPPIPHQASRGAGGALPTSPPPAPPREDQDCVVCWLRPRNATIVHGDSGHGCCCFQCAEELRSRNDSCPICRRGIDLVIRQY